MWGSYGAISRTPATKGPNYVRLASRQQVRAAGSIPLIAFAIPDPLSDVHERSWGDTGVVTSWLKQDYALEGQPQHISAPAVVALRRTGNDWKIVLLLSIPLPENSTS